MKLIYKATGQEVKVGDIITVHNHDRDDKYRVDYLRKPSSPASGGKITVVDLIHGWTYEYYIQIVGAEWIDREDRI